MVYTKEFLIDAFMSRYLEVLDTPLKETALRLSAESLYDRVGKEEFRKYTNLDAAAIKEYINLWNP